MLGRATGLIRETCWCGAKPPTPGANPVMEKAEVARTGVGVLRSSLEASVTEVERRRDSCARAKEASGEQGDGSKDLPTPAEPAKATRVQKLQRTLYRQAKKNGKWKAWSLSGELACPQILAEALRRVMINRGGAGVDGVGTEELRANPDQQKQLLETIKGELKARTYRPSPIRRVYIPKADGKQRGLGIPTVKDRVIQTAMMIVLEPIFEADFHEESYAYRPKRRAQDAVESIKRAILSGRHEIVDADLSGYFDSIPHRELMKLVAKRVSDKNILGLIKGWLRASIVEEDPKTGKKTSHPNERGTPQGGVISPLLANLYLDGLDKIVNSGKKFQAKMVRYADDFVILCYQGTAESVRENLKRWLGHRGLSLNEKKTRMIRYGQEPLDFLGFRIQRRKSRATGKPYPHCEPSPGSCQKIRESIREETSWQTQWKQEEEVFQTVNRRLRGWINYFHYANSGQVFTKMEWQMRERMRRWLWKRHNQKYARYGARYSDQELHERHGLIRFPTSNAPWRIQKA
jgi:RNA-directed DNA polymerase